jgi:hypothetical protein
MTFQRVAPLPRSRTLQRFLIGLIAIGAVAATRLDAQVIYSTFGPNDSYPTSLSLVAIAGQSGLPGLTILPAASFLYTGPSGVALSNLRLALSAGDYGSGAGDVTVAFMKGAHIGSASLVESWNFSGWTYATSQIFSFASITGNQFVTGETYWLALLPGQSGITAGAWQENGLGILGRSFYHSALGTWVDDDALTPVWDVSAVAAVPEPDTRVLLATGLGGLIGIGVARRRRNAVA